jgi:hypothetical protein
VVVTINAMRAEDGDLRGYICIAHDLSRNGSPERRLALSNEAFRKAFDSAPVAVVSQDRHELALTQILRSLRDDRFRTASASADVDARPPRDKR